MQLKIKRSQRTSGMLSSSIMFRVYARIDLNEEEKHLIQKYKLGDLVLYNSASASKHIAGAASGFSEGSAGGLMRGAIGVAMMKLSLRVTIDSLSSGQSVETKDLDEMLGAEQAIIEGCRILRAYLDAAATFDGSEIVIDFNEQSEQVAA